MKRCLLLLLINLPVLTVDRTLYFQLLSLKGLNKVFQSRVILKMEGLHIKLHYLRMVGQHMAGSGLLEMWVESGLLSER